MFYSKDENITHEYIHVTVRYRFHNMYGGGARASGLTAIERIARARNSNRDGRASVDGEKERE